MVITLLCPLKVLFIPRPSSQLRCSARPSARFCMAALYSLLEGFPGGSDGKESAHNASWSGGKVRISIIWAVGSIQEADRRKK